MILEEKHIALAELICKELSGRISDKYILLDIPDYPNIGDALIWLGEKYFFKTVGSRCLYSSTKTNYNFQKVDSYTTICLQGGGNWGDLWRNHQLFRLRVIQEYPDNPIVIFPQTIFYENKKMMEQDSLLMAKHGNITACARDLVSYKILADNFPHLRRLLVPDMAFCIPNDFFRKREVESTKKNLYFKRKDKEGVVTENINLLFSTDDIDVYDWPTIENRFLSGLILRVLSGINRRTNNVFDPFINAFVENCYLPSIIGKGIEFIGKYDKIYTTRLHGVILAVLLNKQIYLLDNSYGKNRGFYETWLEDVEAIKFIEK